VDEFFRPDRYVWRVAAFADHAAARPLTPNRRPRTPNGFLTFEFDLA
jgi:hypothetical protein